MAQWLRGGLLELELSVIWLLLKKKSAFVILAIRRVEFTSQWLLTWSCRLVASGCSAPRKTQKQKAFRLLHSGFQIRIPNSKPSSK